MSDRPSAQREMTLLALIKKVDPDFESERRYDLEYVFSNGRKFYRRPMDFGPYEPLLLNENGDIILTEEGFPIPLGKPARPNQVLGRENGGGIGTEDGRGIKVGTGRG